MVGARNYGRFLGPCLHSIYAQTARPAEVIYADDGSEDESVAVARAFEPYGLKVLAEPFQGVAAVRNAGARVATGDLLLFVDGDNLLAPDFLERQTEALAGGAAFSYGSKHYFGRSQGVWEPRNWDRDQLWVENYVDTSALVRREWFEAAGGWRETSAGTLWDWDLWLRVSRFGPGQRCPTSLFYRHHDANLSARVDSARRDRLGTFRGMIRRSAVRSAVVLAFSGRLPELLPRWLDAVAAASASAPNTTRPELIVLDDSGPGFLTLAGAALAHLDQHFAAVKVIRVHEGGSWRERRPDRAATARFLTGAYHRAGFETQAEVLWYIEDDIVVPPDSFDRLLRLLLHGEEPRAAVAGLYRSRHEPCLVLSQFADGRVVHAEQPPDRAGPCDLTGTGCLMVFRPLAKAVFRPVWHVPGTQAIVPAHDWAYTWQLREAGHPVWVDPAVMCRHYLSETEWV
ncbi:MAG: glycosyltransferase family A protein [Isosphaeraceae bacterium]|nr:glycosyltransferase family A protein [Isosphaeraceae bacterium]